MEVLIQFVGHVLAPLSPGLLFAILTAGLIFGFIYIYKLNITTDDIFHIMMAGWVFILGLFIFRYVTFITGGTTVGLGTGWLGIAIGWALYCGTMHIGSLILKKVMKYIKR